MVVNFSDITIEIEEGVLDVLKNYAQYSEKNEAGGILLGKYIPEQEYYLITTATEPSDKDEAGPLWFNRNYKSAQKRIDELWSQSNGIVNYLGEWHTHPWRAPRPSMTDKNLMKKLVKDGSNVWKHLIMIIVGLDDTFYIGVCDSKHKGKIVDEIVLGE